MDESCYKDVTTTRGLRYHYYSTPATKGKTTLLFCHGFPSTSQDWRFIAPYFQNQGYGIIVPDMLGYAGTDKPTDPAVYVGSLISKDLVDIVDALCVDKVVAIGHDWGCAAISALSHFYPERVSAYAFLAVPYTVPDPHVTVDTLLVLTKKLFGYETVGYWLFFSEENADKIALEHWDSLFSILFPSNPDFWKSHVGPSGKLKEWALSDRQEPLPSYISVDDKKRITAIFRSGGFAAPFCWYKVNTHGYVTEDRKQVPDSHKFPPSSCPIFFGAALQDYICTADTGKHVFKRKEFAKHDITVRDFDADHWLILSTPDQINRELGCWLERVSAKPLNSRL